MKLNNKGVSLIELLISIVIIGIVLVFLFQLLSDLKEETGNKNFAYNNQVNRLEVMYEVQKDLAKYTLIGVDDSYGESDYECLEFYFKKGIEINSSELCVYENYITYKNIDNENLAWEMKGATIHNEGFFTTYIDESSNNYHIKLNIYLYNDPYHEKNNFETNNAVDDIEITYSGKKSDLDTSGSYNLTSATDQYSIYFYY